MLAGQLVELRNVLDISAVLNSAGTRSTIRSSTFSILAMPSAPQCLSGVGGKQMRLRHVEARRDPLARLQRSGVQHTRNPIAAVEFDEHQRLVAQRFGDCDRQFDLMDIGSAAGGDRNSSSYKKRYIHIQTKHS